LERISVIPLNSLSQLPNCCFHTFLLPQTPNRKTQSAIGIRSQFTMLRIMLACPGISKTRHAAPKMHSISLKSGHGKSLGYRCGSASCIADILGGASPASCGDGWTKPRVLHSAFQPDYPKPTLYGYKYGLLEIGPGHPRPCFQS
jgi:hypothetical protein